MQRNWLRRRPLHRATHIECARSLSAVIFAHPGSHRRRDCQHLQAATVRHLASASSPEFVCCGRAMWSTCDPLSAESADWAVSRFVTPGQVGAVTIAHKVGTQSVLAPVIAHARVFRNAFQHCCHTHRRIAQRKNLNAVDRICIGTRRHRLPRDGRYQRRNLRTAEPR